MLKKVLVSVVIVLFIIVVIFIWYFNNQSIKVTVVKESYSMLASDDKRTSLDIKLYVNQKNSYISDINKISSCYIHSYQNKDTYQMNVVDICLVNQTSINNENYYVYNLTMRFSANINTDIIIDEAYLGLNYNNGKSLDIMIGSLTISYYKKEVKEISLACMKAITRRIDNIITIEAIVLRINTKKEVRVTNIVCLNTNIVTQNGKLCDYDNTNEANDLTTIFRTNYNYLDTRINNFDCIINNKGEIAIRLGYYDHYEISAFPLRIDYEVDGKSDSLFIDTFRFFVNNERSIKSTDLIIYEFEYN